MILMERLRWPKLCHTNPAGVEEHAVSLGDDFKAVHEFLRAGVSDVAPTLPRAIEHKITRGIEKGLVEVESREYSTTSISVEDRDLIINAILEEITAETAAAFHNRVPQYLFKILHDSYNELSLKLVTQQNAIPQDGAKMEGTDCGNEVLPHTPPDSPLEETESEISCHYGSDTEGLAEYDWVKDTCKLERRARMLETQLQEVEPEGKAVGQRITEKGRKIMEEMHEVELERDAVDKRRTEILETMEERRLEQDRTGDYGTEAVGYNVSEPLEFYFAKHDGTARSVILNIQKQAVVNRLFNMPANVLTRKIIEAVMQKNEPIRSKTFSSIKYFLEAELLDDGNIRFWAKSTDEYDCRNSDGDVFTALSELPHWDQHVVGSFASHIIEPYESYEVEVKDIPVDMVGLRDRKRKAAVITKLVQQNVTAIPSLHIDLVKDIRFCRRTTNDNSQALVLDFSNRVTANGVINLGLQFQEGLHSCEVFDNKFLDRCGRCQVYGHHADACSAPSRCGKCAGQHRTMLCTSFLTRCVLCDEPHRCGGPRCRAKRARILDKFNARFPKGESYPTLAVPSREPKSLNQSLSSPATDLPTPKQEHVSTTKEQHSDFGSSPVRTAPPDTPTLLAQQLQDKIPAIEAALWSDVSNMERRRGWTPRQKWTVIGHDEPAPLVDEEDEIL